MRQVRNVPWAFIKGKRIHIWGCLGGKKGSRKNSWKEWHLNWFWSKDGILTGGDVGWEKDSKGGGLENLKWLTWGGWGICLPLRQGNILHKELWEELSLVTRGKKKRHSRLNNGRIWTPGALCFGPCTLLFLLAALLGFKEDFHRTLCILMIMRNVKEGKSGDLSPNVCFCYLLMVQT